MAGVQKETVLYISYISFLLGIAQALCLFATSPHSKRTSCLFLISITYTIVKLNDQFIMHLRKQSLSGLVLRMLNAAFISNMEKGFRRTQQWIPVGQSGWICLDQRAVLGCNVALGILAPSTGH